MPSIRCERSVDRPLAECWSFVSEMDHWAPMLTGYEGHRKEGERESVWTLRGDLGPMSRSVNLKVTITEWKDAERVCFELQGLDEVVSGGGAFELAPFGDAPVVVAPAVPWWRRWLSWLLGPVPEPQSVPPGATHVAFEFEIEAGGPMGPMVNAMLGPVAQTVAEALLADVGQHLEAQAEAA